MIDRRNFLQTGFPSPALKGRLSRRESEDVYLPRLRSHNRFRQPRDRVRGICVPTRPATMPARPLSPKTPTIEASTHGGLSGVDVSGERGQRNSASSKLTLRVTISWFIPKLSCDRALGLFPVIPSLRLRVKRCCRNDFRCFFHGQVALSN